MRRQVPTVRRRRVASAFVERDALGLALPGLVCGLFGVGLVLWAQAPIARAHDAAKRDRAAAVGSGTALLRSDVATVESGRQP